MKKYILFFLLMTNIHSESKNISAKAFILQEFNSKKILKEKAVNEILPIASVTKLVTALISISLLNENEMYIVLKSTVPRNESDKSAILKKGEFYTLKDLLLTMLVSSTNVSAISIAINVSGSPELFVYKMNQWAKNEKLHSTKFGDTFGLSPESKSSVFDISKVLDIIARNNSLFEILSTNNYSIKERKGKIQNLSTTNEMPYYKNFRIFGKTGTTNLARKCFAGFVVKGNKKWKLILLGSENIFSDIKILLDELK